MKENKPSQEDDELNKKLRAAWPRLTPRQKKCVLIYIEWLLLQQWIADFPLKWVKWQINLTDKDR